jgi:hypothetical protein
MYLSVLTTGYMVRIWVFWDVMMCHCVSGSCCVGGYFLLQNVWNHPYRVTVLTSWKTWILIITTVKTSDFNCHNVACPHVACTVQSIQCYIHWIVLIHPPVNLDKYPFDFPVFSSFKYEPDLSQLKSKRWCSNPSTSTRNFFWRGSMDWRVKEMLISFVMELFMMVFSSLLRTISKCVSVEKDEYLNYSDLSHTRIAVNI